MTANWRVRIMAAALGGGALGPALAWAQTPPNADGTQNERPAADAEQVQDIIVTARRRNESIQSTPIAVTAITAITLESRAALNAGELQGAAPNLLITQQNSGAGAANLSIRGLAFADVEKSFEPTVAVVVDGAFVGTSTGQFLDLFDIDTIEVLRGPQGTLFGRNTIGGVINVRRTRPTGEWGARVQASVASYGTYDFRSLFNIPVVADGLALKAFYFRSGSDGFYRNVTRNERTGGFTNQNYGIAARLTPGAGIDALLTVEQSESSFDTVNSVITQTGELFCALQPPNQCNRNTTTDLYTVFGEPSRGRFRAPAVTLEINWDVGPLTLTSITAYRGTDEDQTQDFDGSSSDLYFTRRIQTYEQYSQEIRAAGKITDRLDYVVGGFFFDSNYELTQFTRFFGSFLPFPQIASGTNTSYAVFGDFDVRLTDRFRLSFGGRYTYDEKSFNNRFGAFLGAPRDNFDKFTPRIGLDWQPNDNYLLYASWSQGYRSGGFSNRAQTEISTNTPYGTETVDSYEIGAKTAFFDRRLLFNIAAFYAQYNDLQQNTTIPGGPTGNETIVSNVGSATIKGIELDIVARPVRGLDINGALGLLHQDFQDFITRAQDLGGPGQAIFDYSGVRGIYAPDLTASINGNYTFAIGPKLEAVLYGGYRYIAPYDQQISVGPFTRSVVGGVPRITVLSNDPRVRSDTQNLVDASFRLNFQAGRGKAHVMVFGRNLADDRGPNAAFTVAGLWSFASAREPRVVGVQAGFQF